MSTDKVIRNSTTGKIYLSSNKAIKSPGGGGGAGGGEYNIVSTENQDGTQNLAIVDATGQTLNITTNGTHVVAEYAYANVNIPSGTVAQSLNVTENGIYTAPEGYAYSPVNVAVSANGIRPNAQLIGSGIRIINGVWSMVDSNTTLTQNITCKVGDFLVAAIVTRDTLTLSEGWTLISTSNTNSIDETNQRLSWAYKIATSTSETLTVTQASSKRLLINTAIITGASGYIDNGYQYVNANVESAIFTKPSGIILIAVSIPLFHTSTPYPQWSIPDSDLTIQSNTSSQARLVVAALNNNDENIIITRPGVGSTSMILGCLTITGINDWVA